MNKRQRGFTLIEVLAAMAIAGLLIPLVVSSIYQIIKGTAYSNNQVVAMGDIDSASNWVSRDVFQAQTTDLGDGVPGVNHFRVDWVDQTGWAAPGSAAHFAEYTLSGTKLQRNYDGIFTIVARYVSNVGFSRSGNLVSMTITSDVPGGTPRTETLSYAFRPRTDGALQ